MRVHNKKNKTFLIVCNTLYTKHCYLYLMFHNINIHKNIFILFNKKHENILSYQMSYSFSIQIMKINIQKGGGGGGGGINFPPVLGGGGGGGGTMEAFCGGGGGGSDDPL